MFHSALVVLLIVTAFAVTIDGLKLKKDKCSNVTPMSNLVSTELTGEWYLLMINFREMDVQKDEICTSMTIRGRENGMLKIAMNYASNVNVKQRKKSFNATPINRNQHAKLSFKDGATGRFIGDHIIVATDYHNYLIMVDCPKNSRLYNVEVYSKLHIIPIEEKMEAERKLNEANVPERLETINPLKCKLENV